MITVLSHHKKSKAVCVRYHDLLGAVRKMLSILAEGNVDVRLDSSEIVLQRRTIKAVVHDTHFLGHESAEHALDFEDLLHGINVFQRNSGCSVEDGCIRVTGRERQASVYAFAQVFKLEQHQPWRYNVRVDDCALALDHSIKTQESFMDSLRKIVPRHIAL